LTDYQDGNSFSKKWNLPSYNQSNAKIDKYFSNKGQYEKFNKLYEKVTSRVPEMVKDGFTLYQETDYFFNYLYHELGVSNSTAQPRKLSDSKRDQEILKYYIQMRDFYPKGKQLWRLKRSNFIRSKLDPSNIDKLTDADIKSVIDCFHCYNGYPPNKTRFIRHNSRSTIIDNWKKLLHSGNDITINQITFVKTNLQYFGNSSVSELIGWYYPDKYPLMNSNSDSGMRFFGYDIK
jgi:hypothetical protein